MLESNSDFTEPRPETKLIEPEHNSIDTINASNVYAVTKWAIIDLVSSV